MTEQMRIANAFWERAEDHVWQIAGQHRMAGNLNTALQNSGYSMAEFLFDVYDGGDYIPTDAEIFDAIMELFE